MYSDIYAGYHRVKQFILTAMQSRSVFVRRQKVSQNQTATQGISESSSVFGSQNQAVYSESQSQNNLFGQPRKVSQNQAVSRSVDGQPCKVSQVVCSDSHAVKQHIRTAMQSISRVKQCVRIAMQGISEMNIVFGQPLKASQFVWTATQGISESSSIFGQPRKISQAVY